MLEQAIEDEDLTVEAEQPEVEAEQETESAPVADEVEQEGHKADKMHISKEDWIKSGRDPEKWVPPEQFRETTEKIRLKQENRRLQAQLEETSSRMNNIAFSQQQQIIRLRNDLNARRDIAIETANKAEVKELDRQIKDLETEEGLIKQPVAQPQAMPPEIVEWNTENAWLTADHPLRPLANETLEAALKQGKTLYGALKMVDKELAKHRTAPATRGQAPSRSMVDSPSRAAPRGESVSLTFKDLTQEEKQIYSETFEHAGVSQKEFLKTVARIRAEEKK